MEALSSEEALRRAEELRRQLALLKAAKASKRAKAGEGAKAGEAEPQRKRAKPDEPAAAPAPAAPVAPAPAPAPLPSGVRVNPYLAHLRAPALSSAGTAAGGGGYGGGGVGDSAAHSGANGGAASAEDLFDPRLGGEADWARLKARRDRRAFRLVPQGKLTERAELERAKQSHLAFVRDRQSSDARRHFRQLLGAAAASSSSSSGSSSSAHALAPAPIGKGVALSVLAPGPVPELEWWDAPFALKSKAGNDATAPAEAEAALEEQAARGSEPDASAAEPAAEDADAAAAAAAVAAAAVAAAAAAAATAAPASATASAVAEPSAYSKLSVEHCRTLKLVQRPAMLDPPAHMARQGKPAQVYLTKDERRRLRRQARRERHQEQIDKIAAGLIPPPPPKLRLSNMMRVLGDKAVADPSKLEAYVREQVAQRQRAHEARNAATKLTPQEKWDRILSKRAEDEASGPPHVAVFFVADLHSPPELAAANRFKLDSNAQKLGVTGCVVATKPGNGDGDSAARRCNLIVAEGGAKAVLRFEKQVGRIPFPGGAHKVWAGQVARKAFVKRLEYHDVSSAPEARNVLDCRGVPHYWDAALARAQAL
jgi:hypothetical protein